MTGLLGFSSGYHAMMSCDVLLMLGTDFPYRQFLPRDAPALQLDRRGEPLGRRVRVDQGLVGDIRDTLSALLPKLSEHSDDRHLKASLEHYRKSRKSLDELAVGEPGKKPIHPQYVARVVNELAAADAIFCCDVGTPTLWAAGCRAMNGGGRGS